MKNIFKTKYILIFALIVVSCELDEYNPSGTTAETVWTTPKGFQTLVNAAYGNQRTFYGKEDGVVIGEAGTDIWFRAKKDYKYRQMFRYMDFNGSSANTVRNYWRDLWPGINFCNAGIERIKDVDYTATERMKKEGELRFLRAFFYWHVVETWGGVSLRTTETKTPELTAKRSPVEDFYKLIISDLDSAAAWLPEKPENPAEYSRATKKSALAMLARACLSRAYYSLDKNNKTEADAYFTRAKEISHYIIDNAASWGASLYPEYADLWKNELSGTNKNSKEALYIISNSTNPSINYDINGNRLHMWFAAKYSDKPGMQMDMANGMDNFSYFQPTQFLLDLFDDTKDSRFDGSFQTVWYCNSKDTKGNPTIFKWNSTALKKYGKDASLLNDTIKNGDTALYVTNKVIADKKFRKYVVIDRDSLFRADTIYTTSDIFVPLKKFRDPNRTAYDAQPGSNDILVIRLAEIYLIAAEAEFQLGDNASAANDINVIRNRASKTHSGDMNISPSEVTLDFILDERAREFAGEHLRWFDLKRTRTLVQRIQKYNKDIQIPSNLLEKGNGYFENALVRPVPQTELDALINGKEFGQNPGYY